MAAAEYTEIKIRWDGILDQVAAEFRVLPAADRQWLAARLAVISHLKGRLHALFLDAGGDEHCAACLGACCGSGRNHMTLVELLTLLSENESVPQVDFRGQCPFLGASGCLLNPRRRPFNCVTFLCETVESGLSHFDLENFSTLEKELRNRYAEFESRFAGASLRGLLIRGTTLDGKPFLARPGHQEVSGPIISSHRTMNRSPHP